MSMENRKYASLKSQMDDDLCEVEDTEEIFWLRESDDYDSKVKLGNALVGQYRYKDAIEAYQSAMQIRSDDKLLYIRIAGAFLTIGQFNNAHGAYFDAIRHGATEKSIAYYIGIWHYLKEEYSAAAECFLKCMPCNDEMAIAVIYWHTLCCARLGDAPTLLTEIRNDMQVGHHTAYLTAMCVFSGATMAEAVLTSLNEEKSELNFVVSAYGLCVYLESVGKTADAEKLRADLFAKESVWPCISYLAAWRDAFQRQA